MKMTLRQSRPRAIQVFEHDRLVVGDAGFEAKHFDALVRYNDQHASTFFKIGHRQIRFTSFVGVIQVGNLAIEILPKAEKGALADKGKWQGVLLKMLREVGWLKVDAGPEADLHLRRSSLIDLYLAAFLEEVERLRRAGLIKKYRMTEANLYKVKGRIVFREQVSRNFLHRERMYTSHEVYDQDNVFNRILKCALGIVMQMAMRQTTMAQAAGLSLAFEHISESRIAIETFERLVWKRNAERYRRAIQLARLIILNYAPDMRGGQEHVFAILFDMNQLFERFILVQLMRAQRNYASCGLQVEGQKSRLFWASKSIRPDVVAKFGDGSSKNRVIIDTKWKVPHDDLPADDDLKQMYTYNLHFGGHRSVLLYPRASQQQDGIRESFKHSEALPKNHEHHCATYYLDLFDNRHQLRSDIGTELIDKVIFDGLV